MGYPVRYRSGARKYHSGSFQEPAVVPGRKPDRDPMHPPYRDPPEPANDPWPVPANDNEPPSGRWDYPPFPKLPPWPGLPMDAAMSGGMMLLPPGVRKAVDIGLTLYKYWPNMSQEPVVDWPQAGWTIGCGPVAPPLAYVGRWAFHKTGTPGVCGLTGQALGEGSPVVTWKPSAYINDRKVLLAKFNGDRLVGRWANVTFWETSATNTPMFRTARVATVPAIVEVPDYVPATVANPLPSYVGQPVGNDVPGARPLPARLPSSPRFYVGAARSPRLRGDLHPSRPGVVIDSSHPLPPRVPPGKGTKERKATEQVPGLISGALGAAAGVYESAKFANDLINAFYDALPGKHTAKTPQDKLAELYRRYNDVDIDKAIAGVLKAVAYEKAGAYIDRARRTASNNLGLHMHIQIPTGGGPRV